MLFLYSLMTIVFAPAFADWAENNDTYNYYSKQTSDLAMIDGLGLAEILYAGDYSNLLAEDKPGIEYALRTEAIASALVHKLSVNSINSLGEFEKRVAIAKEGIPDVANRYDQLPAARKLYNLVERRMFAHNWENLPDRYVNFIYIFGLSELYSRLISDLLSEIDFISKYSQGEYLITFQPFREKLKKAFDLTQATHEDPMKAGYFDNNTSLEGDYIRRMVYLIMYSPGMNTCFEKERFESSKIGWAWPTVITTPESLFSILTQTIQRAIQSQDFLYAVPIADQKLVRAKQRILTAQAEFRTTLEEMAQEIDTLHAAGKLPASAKFDAIRDEKGKIIGSHTPIKNEVVTIFRSFFTLLRMLNHRAQQSFADESRLLEYALKALGGNSAEHPQWENGHQKFELASGGGLFD